MEEAHDQPLAQILELLIGQRGYDGSRRSARFPSAIGKQQEQWLRGNRGFTCRQGSWAKQPDESQSEGSDHRAQVEEGKIIQF
ncbi:MAG: hypothetical protein ACKO8I_01565 [Cyanobacteriota bacterium]